MSMLWLNDEVYTDRGNVIGQIMELLTQEIKKQLPALYSQSEIIDPICSLKFFTPDSSWTWYITEGSEQEDGDWMFFAKVISHIL